MNLRLLFRLPILLCVAAFAACGGSEGENGDAPAESTFSKSYGGPRYDAATVVLPTRDGGILLAGQADATRELRADRTDGPRGDLWISKLDANGDVEVARVIGEIPASEFGNTHFLRARQTADGGTVLVGLRKLTGSSSNVPADLAVTRLDAQGNVLWSRSYDSGSWLNYEYRQRTASFTADDFARDVWQLPDGGFVVAGTSTADLVDRLSLGFPCPLVGDEETDPCQDSLPGQPGGSFVNAYSTVVMRLSADGELRWLRRFTEEAFLLETRELSESRPPVVRGAHDGGALLIVEARRGAVVRRLLGDGSSLPVTFLEGASVPTDVEQTDDPGANGERDGLRNDGFVMSAGFFILRTRVRIVKLSGNGSVQWFHELSEPGGRSVRLQAVHQRCDPTAADCIFLAGGSVTYDGRPGFMPTTYVALLDDSGEILREIESIAATTIRDIRSEPGSTHHRFLAANEAHHFSLVQLIADGSERSENGPGLESAPRTDLSFADWPPPSGELTSDGVLLFDSGTQRVMRVDEQGSIISTLDLAGAGDAGETAVAAVEVEPGEFIVAGQRNNHDSIREFATGWLLRYEISGSADRLVWQRNLTNLGIPGGIEALAASGDGGVVAAVRGGDDIRLLKVDGGGRVIWQSAPITLRESGYSWREVHAVNGGYVGLLQREAQYASHARFVRFDAAGSILAQYDYAIGFSSLAPATDGGFVLAAGAGARACERADIACVENELLSLVKVDAIGVPQWARRYLPSGQYDVWGSHPIIRPKANGFVIGVTERSLLTRLQGGASVARGATNVALLEVDGDGAPRWVRVYGALLEEELHDLHVRNDGMIFAAGQSFSLGENTEAWLMKLGPDGMITTGCSAHLGDFPTEFMIAEDFFGYFELLRHGPFEGSNAPNNTFDLPSGGPAMRAHTGSVIARQCAGTANTAPMRTPPPARLRLTVSRVGDRNGVVTSTPTGIACGTQLGDQFCAADFPAGARVVLQADPQNFRRWISQCEEGTGSSNLQCIITLDADRTVEVQFGDLLEDRHNLTVLLSGSGSGVVTGPGFTCPPGCAQLVEEGMITLSATADPGSTFQGWTSGCTSISPANECLIDLTGPHTVSAVFAPSTLSTLTVGVQRGSPERVIQSDPAGILCGADCSHDFPARLIILRSNVAGTVFEGCDDVREEQPGFFACHMNMNGVDDRGALAYFPPF